MTACIACGDREEHDPDYESGWRCCRRAHDRMLAALRDIPVLVDELSGLGYVERDVRRRECTTKSCPWPARWRGVAVRSGHVGSYCDRDALRLFCGGHAFGFSPVLLADPVAHAVTAGPTNGASSQPRVGGSALPSVPIHIDPTDLLAPARPASLAVADVGLYASDQVGHLAVATELEFWARDWADLRGEGCPMPTVRLLAGWLLDRLDWACASHPALDEFAGKLRHLRSTLTAACGRSEPRPEVLEAPCPGCGQLALWRDGDLESIACGCCPVLLSEVSYADHVNKLIEEAS